MRILAFNYYLCYYTVTPSIDSEFKVDYNFFYKKDILFSFNGYKVVPYTKECEIIINHLNGNRNKDNEVIFKLGNTIDFIYINEFVLPIPEKVKGDRLKLLLKLLS